MATTVAGLLASAQAGLLALIEARAEMADVQVTAGHPGDDVDVNETVFLHDCESSADWKLLAGGTIPPREAELTIEVVVQVGRLGNEQDSVRARALELAAVVEEATRDDFTLGGTVRVAHVEEVKQTTVRPESRAAWLCQVVLTVLAEARIS
jgi:hypothetical protein